MLEANQSKLAERLKSVDAKDRELDRVLREELTLQAFHDALTGLPNQSLFRDRVEQAVKRLERIKDVAGHCPVVRGARALP